jgi:hypothetical protein
VRKRAEGFDYEAAAPSRDEKGRGAESRKEKVESRMERRNARPPKLEPKLPGNSMHGSGDAAHRHGGQSFRNFSSTSRLRRRSYRRHR